MSALDLPSPEKTEAALLNDPSVSYWLKNAILTARHRDLLDAAKDARILADLLEQRVTSLIEEYP